MTKEYIAHFHLPGLFEFYDFYKAFLSVYNEHRDWFYEWCRIDSIYGAPADCIWGGGRVGFGDNDPEKVLELTSKYGISPRLTFSNSLLTKGHLTDKKCNRLCETFESENSGIIVCSDILIDYIKENYPQYYFVSSTTKVITHFDDLKKELSRKDFRFVCPDFRFNNDFEKLILFTQSEKSKLEMLVNECCDVNCRERKACYMNVSQKALGADCTDHICLSPKAEEGYKFSRAMESPAFISIEDIKSKYLPMGISNFKIEGRSLGSAMILEFLLYYLTKSEHQLKVRESIYLDSSLDLF